MACQQMALALGLFSSLPEAVIGQDVGADGRALCPHAEASSQQKGVTYSVARRDFVVSDYEFSCFESKDLGLLKEVMDYKPLPGGGAPFYVGGCNECRFSHVLPGQSYGKWCNKEGAGVSGVDHYDFCPDPNDPGPNEVVAPMASPTLAARIADSAWQDLAQRLAQPQPDDLTATNGDTVNVHFEDCGGFMHITKLEPRKFTLGKKTEVSLSVNSNKPIEDGANYHIVGKYRFITLINQRHSFCHSHTVSALGMKIPVHFPYKCPLPAFSTHKIKHTIQLPSSLPAQLMHSSVNIRVTSKTGEEAICVKLKISKARASEQVTTEGQNVTIV